MKFNNMPGMLSMSVIFYIAQLVCHFFLSPLDESKHFRGRYPATRPQFKAIIDDETDAKMFSISQNELLACRSLIFGLLCEANGPPRMSNYSDQNA